MLTADSAMMIELADLRRENELLRAWCVQVYAFALRLVLGASLLVFLSSLVSLPDLFSSYVPQSFERKQDDKACNYFMSAYESCYHVALCSARMAGPCPRVFLEVARRSSVVLIRVEWPRPKNRRGALLRSRGPRGIPPRDSLVCRKRRALREAQGPGKQCRCSSYR